MQTSIELFHILVIVLLFCAVPFLYVHKWRWLTITSTIYSAIFIIGNRLSQLILGQCFITKLAKIAGGNWDDGEWFIIKMSRVLYGFVPSKGQISYIEYGMILIVIIGIAFSFWKVKR
jgi:hypothetical protein